MKDTWAKKELVRKGWSYRKAAVVLDITYQYLCDVCNGVHTSIRLNGRISNLPNYSDFLSANPDFFAKNKHTRALNKIVMTFNLTK